MKVYYRDTTEFIQIGQKVAYKLSHMAWRNGGEIASEPYVSRDQHLVRIKLPNGNIIPINVCHVSKETE